VLVCPAADLVAVRLGKTPRDRYPDLARFRARLVEVFMAAR
jgi:hypothetical protein